LICDVFYWAIIHEGIEKGTHCTWLENGRFLVVRFTLAEVIWPVLAWSQIYGWRIRKSFAWILGPNSTFGVYVFDSIGLIVPRSKIVFMLLFMR
jgi:hypothetical protein